MPKQLPSTLLLARALLHNDRRWLLFVEVQLVSGPYVRLVHADRSMQADGRVWQAASMQLQPPDEDDEGTLGDLVVTVSNVSREPFRLVETDELLGQDLVAHLQYEGALREFEPTLQWQHRIVRSEISDRVATFECAHAAGLVRVPGPLYDRETFPQLLPSPGLRIS